MAELASANTVIIIHGGMSVPADEYKKVDGQSPELRYAIAKLFDSSQAFMMSYITDPGVREDYNRRIRAAADEIMEKVRARELTPHEGAQQANAIRNQILKLMRENSTAVGRSFAEKLKKEGATLDVVQEKYAKTHFSRRFSELSEAERNRVWAAIVDSAGRGNKSVNIKIRYYGVAGKTLLVASLAIAVYDIYTADDKERQVAKEAASIGSAIVVGAAVTVGLAPFAVAAPIVFIGVFVAGTLATVASDDLFDYFWPER